jgi:hypothetical protein
MHRDEAGFVQDAQMARDTGLVDPSLLNDVVDLALAAAQHFDDAASASSAFMSRAGTFIHGFLGTALTSRP